MQSNERHNKEMDDNRKAIKPTSENIPMNTGITSGEHLPKDVRQGAAKKVQGRLDQVKERLQTVTNTRWSDGKSLNTVPTSTPRYADTMAVETSEAEDVFIDLAKWIRRLIIPLSLLAWAGIVILFLWGSSHVIRAILLFVVAALLAYALAPLVTLFTRVMPRFLAILIVYLIVLGGVSALVYLVVRTAVEQITSLSGYIGFLLTPASGGNQTPLEQALKSFNISSSQISSARAQIIAQTEGLAGNILPLLTGLVSASLDILLVAVLSVYLLIDGSRATSWFRQNMPRRQQGRVRFLVETLQRIVGGYIRGQLLLCSLIGVLVGAGMQVLGVPYALLLGVLAFVLEFIPILGTLASGAICVLLALTKGWFIAVIVLIYFVVVHVIEGDVVGPRIVGKAIGLHPVVALLALIIGGDLFGIWGALFASPIAGVLQAFLIALWSEWREMHPNEFQQVKDKIAQKIEVNVASAPLDPEPAAKLLLKNE